MSPEEIKHFLVIHDVARGKSQVKQFGTDYERAQDAYEEAERANRGRDDIDIVLLSADSLATIKKTHSSYFSTSKELREELLSA